MVAGGSVVFFTFGEEGAWRVEFAGSLDEVPAVSANCPGLVIIPGGLKLVDFCRLLGHSLLNCISFSGRDILTEDQLTTLLQTAVRMWTTRLLCLFFFFVIATDGVDAA